MNVTHFYLGCMRAIEGVERFSIVYSLSGHAYELLTFDFQVSTPTYFRLRSMTEG